MADESHFDLVRSRLVSGELSDAGFDALLPSLTRARSSYTWTPVDVARRAAWHFAQQGATRVLDVGCGPGKFCIVAGLGHASLSFCGVDHSTGLTRTARELSKSLRASNVEIRTGNALDVTWHTFDGFYFFNPFSEDSRVGGKDLLRVAELLRGAPRQSVVITYHGLGGPIPSTYELASEERVGSGPLRIWRKTRSREAAWYHLDYAHDVSRVPRSYLERKLGAMRSADELGNE